MSSANAGSNGAARTLKPARMLGEQRVEHLGIQLMQLVSCVHHREARLELEKQADIAELEVGVDQHHLLVRQPVEQQRDIGGHHRLAASALGRGDGDQLASLGPIRFTRGPGCDVAPLQDVVGELLDRRLDLRLVEWGLDHVRDTGTHRVPKEIGGDRLGHHHQDQHRILVVQAPHLLHGLLVAVRGPEQEHPQLARLDGLTRLFDGASYRQPAFEELLGGRDEVIVLVDHQ